MKTKIKRHSRSVISVILAVCMLVSCLTVGLIATDAARISADESVGYGSAKLKIGTSQSSLGSQTEQSVSLISNAGEYTISNATASTTYYFKIKADSDIYGNASFGSSFDSERNLALITGGSFSDGNNACSFKTTAAGDYKIVFNLSSGGQKAKIVKVSTECTKDLHYIVTGERPLINPSANASNYTWPNSWTAAGERNQLVYSETDGCYKTPTYAGIAANTTFKFRIVSVPDTGTGQTGWEDTHGFPKANKVDANSLVKTWANSNDNNSISMELNAKANITIFFDDSKNDTKQITVVVTPAESTLTVGAPTGGSVSITRGTTTVSTAGQTIAAIPYEGEVTLKATPGTNYTFGGWPEIAGLEYVGDTSSNEIVARVVGSATVTANFTAASFNIINGTENCTLTAPKTAPHSTEVTVSATAAKGYYIDGLYYKVKGSDTPITICGSSDEDTATTTDDQTITMPQNDITIYAWTHKKGHQVVKFNGESEGGYVSVGEKYDTDAEKCYIKQSFYDGDDVLQGTEVRFCAMPKSGYYFAGWYLDSGFNTPASETDENIVVTAGANGDMARYAKFESLLSSDSNVRRLLIYSSNTDAHLHIWNIDAGVTDGNMSNTTWNDTGGNPKLSSYTDIGTVTINGKTFYILETTDTDFKFMMRSSGYDKKSTNEPNITTAGTYIYEYDNGTTLTEKQLSEYEWYYPVHFNVDNPEIGENNTRVRAFRKNGETLTVHADVATANEDDYKVICSTKNDSNSADVTTTYDAANNQFTLTMPAAPITVDLKFTEKEYYPVTFTAGAGGTIKASTGTTYAEANDIKSGTRVKEGTAITFVATANEGYDIQSWTGDVSGTGATKTISAASFTSAKTARVYFVKTKGTSSTATYLGYEKGKNNPNDWTHFVSTYAENGRVYGYIDDISAGDWYFQAYNKSPSGTEKYSEQYYKNNSAVWADTVFTTDITFESDSNRRHKFETTNLGTCYFIRFTASSNVKAVKIDLGPVESSSSNKARPDNDSNTYHIIPIYNTDVDKVTIYAKDGSWRNDSDYDYFPGIASTTITGTGVTKLAQEHKNAFTTAVAEKGTTIRVTTTIDANHSVPFYIRGFSFNGVTPALIEPNAVDTSVTPNTASGIYYQDYTIPADYDLDYLEITPIYYYRHNNTDPDGDFIDANFVQFFIENYDEALQSKGWGNTLSVYPYYQNSAGAYVEAKQNAFGGYPGQPVIYYGGRRFIEIPTGYTTFAVDNNGTQTKCGIKGVTLSNDYYDYIHRYILREVTEHKQTYDYDDFYKIYKETSDGKEVNATAENGRQKAADQITFAFKYRETTNNFNHGDATDVMSTSNDTNFGNTVHVPYESFAVADKDTLFGNGWDDLLDYMDRPVDIFGKQLSAEDQAKEPLLIVSDDYNVTYAGYYATTWTVYRKNGANYTKIAEIAPSALIVTDDPEHPVESGSSTGTRLDPPTPYPTVVDTGVIQKKLPEYKAAYAALKDYANTPALITYESAIKNSSDYEKYFSDIKYWKKKSDGSTTNTNPNDSTNYEEKSRTSEVAIRSDGRWYYSYYNDTVHASIRIEYKNDESDEYWTTDAFKGDTNQGTVTGGKAYFDNTELNNAGESYRYKTETGDLTADYTKYYDLQAVAAPGYVFAGWWFERDGIATDVNADHTKLDGESSRTSNAVFIARYIKNPSGAVKVNHTLAPTSIQDGKTYISIKAINKSDTNVTAWLTNPSGDHFVEDTAAIDNPTYMSYKSGYKFEITLKTVADNDKIAFDRFAASGVGSTAVFSTANQATTDNVTTTSFEVDVDDLFEIDNDGFPKQKSDYETLDFLSYLKIGENALKYNFTYAYQSRLYGQQTYTAKEAISETMFRNYFTFADTSPYDLKFRTDALTQEFLASRAPYEDNYKQTIIWNFSSYDTESTNYNSSTGEITLKSGNVTSTPNDDKTIHISFEFPYEYTVSQSITTQEEGQDPVTTPYPYDVAVTPTVTKDDDYVKADDTSEKISFVKYQAVGEDTITYRPVLQKDGVTSYLNSNKGKMQYLDWVSLSTCHHSKRDGESDPTEEPVFITAPDQVVQVTESEGVKTFTPLNFQYWSMMDKDHKEYKKCYSKEFNMAVYQTSIISPVYSETNLNTGRTTDASASITFLEYSRNQWNCGGGNESGLTQGGANAYWKNFGDRIFTDFVLSFELKNQKLKTQNVKYRAGVVIETVGDLSAHGMETDNTYYQNAYEALTDTEKTAIANGAKNAISNNTSHAAVSDNFLFSYVNFNQLDNKNSAEYHYAFANVSMTRAAEEDYGSHSYDSSYITATTRKDKVYRAFSFIIDDKNTPDDTSDDVVTVSTPVYFTIYDVATVADGETL